MICRRCGTPMLLYDRSVSENDRVETEHFCCVKCDNTCGWDTYDLVDMKLISSKWMYNLRIASDIKNKIEEAILKFRTKTTINNEYGIKTRKEVDMVAHPPHYMIPGRKESIVEMYDKYGAEGVKYFCRCNSMKYRYRADLKNGKEDLQKADWYDRLADRLELLSSKAAEASETFKDRMVKLIFEVKGEK